MLGLRLPHRKPKTRLQNLLQQKQKPQILRTATPYASAHSRTASSQASPSITSSCQRPRTYELPSCQKGEAR